MGDGERTHPSILPSNHPLQTSRGYTAAGLEAATAKQKCVKHLHKATPHRLAGIVKNSKNWYLKL